MASATGASSGAAVAALLQKASQQYLECRRNVSAKVDEVKVLDSEIQALFQHITRLGESGAARAAKSVGHLELTIVEVAGAAPVEGAVITVEIDPEYEEPQEKEAEAPVAAAAGKEKEEEVEKQADAVEGEDAAVEAEEAAEAGVDKVTEEEKDSPKGEEQVPEVDQIAPTNPTSPRTVQWENAAAFPVTFKFDPVQSREAVVTISIVGPAQEGEDVEPVKEFDFSVSSLFQTGSLDRWFEVKEDVEIVEETTITEIVEEAEPVTEGVSKDEVSEEVAKDEKVAVEKEDAVEDEASEEKKVDPVVESADETTAVENEEVAATVETAEEESAEDEQVVEEEESTTTTVVVETKEEITVHVSRIHVKATFTLSEIERLSQTAVALSKQKQEAERALLHLEREAASLRTKYERLNASQRSLGSSSGGLTKPRSALLGGRTLGGAPPRVEKSRYQKMKDSVSAVLTPQRQQVLTSFAIFVGSVALFHFQGENLLA